MTPEQIEYIAIRRQALFLLPTVDKGETMSSIACIEHDLEQSEDERLAKVKSHLLHLTRLYDSFELTNMTLEEFLADNGYATDANARETE